MFTLLNGVSTVRRNAAFVGISLNGLSGVSEKFRAVKRRADSGGKKWLLVR